ncbi:hypothetical protein Tco_0206506 [Tanacetum coccineum]
MKVEESLNVTFDESPPPTKLSPLVDDDVGEEEAIKNNTKVVNNNNEKDESIEVDEVVNIKESKNHPLDQVEETLCVVAGLSPPNYVEYVLYVLCALNGNERSCHFFVASDAAEGWTSPKVLLIVVDGFDGTERGYQGRCLGEVFVGVTKLNFFLGLQIKQMEDEIFFNQSKYIKEMLKKFGLEDSKPTKTPMLTKIKLTKDDEANSVDSSKYRGMIGSLLYLTASRPDIMFSVCLCARFQENPKTTHLEAVKHIFRYVRGTTHLGLWYPKGTGVETIVYADSDHAGDYVDRKSTSGVCTFMGCCLTSWFAKKQTAIAISMTEAEYVSAGKACQQALWMKPALIDYDIRLDDISIVCDNKGAIDLSKNPVQHSRTKHIEIRHHFLRDNVQKGNISIEKVASEYNIADILTKSLKREVFIYLRL